ncbi:MAG TPA: hypothetical protein VHO03_16995 [Ignavibacteriales bacterium]|nr:hypothetical protein [Ignavibacteriales bacterium]
MTMYAEGFEYSLDPSRGSSQATFEIGTLVFFKKDKRFCLKDQNGSLIDTISLGFLTDEWNTLDGTGKVPKPDIIGEAGEIEERGDKVVYTAINGSRNNILILGSYQSLLHEIGTKDAEGKDYEKNLTLDGEDIKSLLKKTVLRRNKKRIYEVVEDAEGNLTLYLEGLGESKGSLSIKVKGTENAGNVKLELNGKFLIIQKDTGDKEVIATLEMDNTKDAEKVKILDKYKNRIELNKKGAVVEAETIHITGKDATKEITMKKILTDLVDAIIKMTQPTTNGSTIAPPVNMADFMKVKQDAEKLLKEN